MKKFDNNCETRKAAWRPFEIGDIYSNIGNLKSLSSVKRQTARP